MPDILAIAQSLQPEISQFLRDIVAMPSLSGQEGEVILRIKKEMKKIGFEETRVDGLGNLLGRIGNGSRTLVIDGHIDVVDVGNPDLWEVDPFEGDLREGVIYGRGACDQKGGVAGAIYAVKILKEIGVPEDLTLWISCTVQEEDCDGLCWKYIIEEEKFIPDAVLLTEPTGLNIYRGQRGRMEIKVQTEGLSCHGSAPERGVNAVYKMAPIIREIEELNTRLKDDPFLGRGTVTISEVKSTSPSLCAVADSCTIHLDRRLTAGETIDTALEEIRNLPSFKKAQAKVWLEEYSTPSYTGKVFPMQKYYPTWALEENHPVLKTAVESYRKLFNKNPLVDKWTFSTNGIATMGLHNIPTFGFGPGEEKYAHSPYEQIPVDHLAKAMAFYAEFVRNF
jgi:putative selenium metabolism hydrolase